MFRKKKPWVRFVNLIPGVEQVHPVIPISKMKVEWIKRAAKDYREKKEAEENPAASQISVSRCPGILNLFQVGYIVPNPIDFVITTNDVNDYGQFQWEASADYSYLDGKKFIDSHKPIQYRDFVPSRPDMLGSIIKVNTKWRVTMSPGWVLLQLPVPYPDHNYFNAVPGILDCENTNSVNVQLEWYRKQDKILIKSGTPLCHYVPVPKNLAMDLIVEPATADDEYLDQSMTYLDFNSFNRDRKQYTEGASRIIKNWFTRSKR